MKKLISLVTVVAVWVSLCGFSFGNPVESLKKFRDYIAYPVYRITDIAVKALEAMPGHVTSAANLSVDITKHLIGR